MTPLERFRSFCRFEPETGCVVWTGGRTKGRGHHVDYPAFWFEGRRWFGHRWSAHYIHGIDIGGFDVDHCCPNIPKPNTLCVEHVQATTPKENRDLQDLRRRMIHLQVGLITYPDVYGHTPDPLELDDALIPFHTPPAWLYPTIQKGDENVDCPF